MVIVRDFHTQGEVPLNYIKPLCLTWDIAFKTFFKGHPDLLPSLLSSFLPLSKDSKIEEVFLVDPESNPPSLDTPPGKTFVLDMKVKIRRKTKGILLPPETVNVEMQTTSQKHFTDRLLAYSARLYSGQIKSGERYETLAPVYSLVFSTVNINKFKVRGLEESHYHICSMRREGTPDVVVSDGIKFVIVELAKFSKGLNELLDGRDQWCYLLKESENLDERDFGELERRGPEMGQALGYLWKLSQDEAIKEQLEAAEKQRKDRQAQLDWAIEEGERRGEQRGEQRGKKEGRKEGRKEGKKEGRKEERKEVALRLLRGGVDIKTIQDATELSPEELEKLKTGL